MLMVGERVLLWIFTGDGCGVVWCVRSQVLRSLSGGLGKTLGASTVTLTRREEKRERKITK